MILMARFKSTLKSNVKTLILATNLLILFSCKEVYFESPQPTLGENLSGFPKEIQGNFTNNQFNEILTKTDSSAFLMAISAMEKLFDIDTLSRKSSLNEIELKVSNNDIEIKLKDRNNTTYFSSSAALSNNLVVKKIDNYLVINKKFIIIKTDYNKTTDVYTETEMTRWQPLILKKESNSWQGFYVQSPWDKKSQKSHEEKSVIESIDLHDLKIITKKKSNHLLTFNGESFSFEPFTESVYSKKRKQKEKSAYIKTYNKTSRKEAHEIKYCKKLYQWLYDKYLRDSELGYKIEIGEVYSTLEVETDSILLINETDSIIPNEEFDFEPDFEPLFNNQYFILREFSRNSLPDLCNFHNIIPKELALDIIQKNLIYNKKQDTDYGFYWENANFDLNYFESKIKPHIDLNNVTHNTPMAEDCGCGMGLFTRSDYRTGKRNYNQEIKK